MLNSENSLEKDKMTKDPSVDIPVEDDVDDVKKKKKTKKREKQIAEKITIVKKKKGKAKNKKAEKPFEVEKAIATEKPAEKEIEFSGKMCKIREKDLKGKKLKAIKRLVAKPKFICLKCGRVSSEKSNLCEPEKI